MINHAQHNAVQLTRCLNKQRGKSSLYGNYCFAGLLSKLYVNWKPFLSQLADLLYEFRSLPRLRRRNLKTEVSLWKHVKCFPSTLPRRNFTSLFGFTFLVFEENLLMEITWLLWRHRFRKASFSKCFQSTRKRKASVFKFLRCEERFRKARFSWRINVEGRHNHWNKPAFSIFSSSVWSLRCLRNGLFYLLGRETEYRKSQI